MLNVGVYWLEVRAYDPYDNYCTATFKIIVQAPEESTSPAIPGYNLVAIIGITVIITAFIAYKKPTRK